MILNNLFVDRKDELNTLKRIRDNVVLIYGRRRVGKTRLIKEFIKNKKAFYFIAQRNNIEAEFNRFLNKFNKKFDVFVEAEDFEEFFEKIRDWDVYIVIDEFSYLVEKNSEVPSLFQGIIDEIISGSKVRLIISGSLIGTMESLMAYKNPLYGRVKVRMKLNPLRFVYLKDFFKNIDFEKLVRLYGVFGGVPAYICDYKPGLSFEKNLKNLFFNKHSYLYDDVERILKDELREPDVYMNILRIIAEGETKLGNIASKSYLDITNMPKYLNVLEKMDIIKKEYSVLGKSRRLIKIKDNYVLFWSKFVYPYREEIELGNYIFDKKEFNKYLGRVFEDVAMQLIMDLKLFEFTKIGRWWWKDKEIDIVGINEEKKELMAVEVKWKELGLKDVKEIVKDLEEKVKYVDWFNSERREKLGVFAKKMDKRAKAWLKKQGYLGWDLRSLEKML